MMTIFVSITPFHDTKGLTDVIVRENDTKVGVKYEYSMHVADTSVSIKQELTDVRSTIQLLSQNIVLFKQEKIYNAR